MLQHGYYYYYYILTNTQHAQVLGRLIGAKQNPMHILKQHARSQKVDFVKQGAAGHTA
jgi:hypothetical protein